MLSFIRPLPGRALTAREAQRTPYLFPNTRTLKWTANRRSASTKPLSLTPHAQYAAAGG